MPIKEKDRKISETTSQKEPKSSGRKTRYANMPPAKLVVTTVGGMLRNVITGYVEPPIPTNAERTETRRENIVRGCQQLLDSLVGPGDLLDSETRAVFAKEAYAAVNSCDGCKGVPCLRDPSQFVTFNEKSISHTYVTNGPFRDIAHAIINSQDKLDNVFFDTFVLRIQERYPYKLKDDCTAMAVEFAVIAA